MSVKIFLNYRRDDARWPASILYYWLAQSFPREHLFMDVAGYIRPGDDFVEVLKAKLSDCKIMIVVIGPQWLALPKDGRPRIADPSDIVHIEIATALNRNIRVIPVLVEPASMPGEGELPEPLKALARKQAIRLSHESLEADADKLVRELQEVLGELRKLGSAASGPVPHIETVADLAIERTQTGGERNYFVIRTERDEKERNWQEIQQGRLRQGWGISGLRLPPGEYSVEKMEEWCKRYARRCKEYWAEEVSREEAERRYRILYPMTEIQAGDRIVIPRMPTEESFCIAIANGPYEFDEASRPDPQNDDHRHVIPLKTDLRIIPHVDKNIDAQFVGSAVNNIGYGKAVNRIRREDLKTWIENLIKYFAPTAS